MTEPRKPLEEAGPAGRGTGVLRRAGGWLAAALEWPLSRRGLGVSFFLLAALLVPVGWLRPSLSPDLSTLNLPLCAGDGPTNLPEAVLYGPRRPLALSVGALLLLVIAVGIAVVLWRPRWLGPAAGLLLVGALAANAATLFNYPALIELLDLEQEQRHMMVSILPSRTDAAPMAGKSNDRAHAAPPVNGRVSAAPVRDGERGSLFRAWGYRLYGPYLVYLAVGAVLLAGRGSLGRRLACLLAWVAAGGVLAGLACNQRLRAEYHWGQALTRAAQRDYPEARLELAEAVDLFPEFQRMQRAWLLAGELDYREGRITRQERFFRAAQCQRNQEWVRALIYVAQLSSEAGPESPAVQYAAAAITTAAGRRAYDRGRLVAAEDLWRRATLLAPEIRDSWLLLAVAQARLDRGRPDRVEASLGLLLSPGLADQALRADALVILGNALVEAGRIEQARRRYAESLDLFTLPRSINFGAAKGLGGL